MTIYVPEKRFRYWLTNCTGKFFTVEGDEVEYYQNAIGMMRTNTEHYREKFYVTGRNSDDYYIAIINPEIHCDEILADKKIFYTIDSPAPILGCHNFKSLADKRAARIFFNELCDCLRYDHRFDLENTKIFSGCDEFETKYFDGSSEVCITDPKMMELFDAEYELVFGTHHLSVSNVFGYNTKICITSNPNLKYFHGDQKVVICEFGDKDEKIEDKHFRTERDIVVSGCGVANFNFPIRCVIAEICDACEIRDRGFIVVINRRQVMYRHPDYQ